MGRFRREYLLRLPLPLAQLYGRANNAKDACGRHDNAFYLFEALIKLTATPLIAAYRQEIAGGAKRDPELDRLLGQLDLPSLGHWTGFLRELAKRFGERAAAATHPLGNISDQLTRIRHDFPAALALYRRIKNGPDGATTRWRCDPAAEHRGSPGAYCADSMKSATWRRRRKNRAEPTRETNSTNNRPIQPTCALGPGDPPGSLEKNMSASLSRAKAMATLHGKYKLDAPANEVRPVRFTRWCVELIPPASFPGVALSNQKMAESDSMCNSSGGEKY